MQGSGERAGADPELWQCDACNKVLRMATNYDSSHKPTMAEYKLSQMAGRPAAAALPGGKDARLRVSHDGDGECRSIHHRCRKDVSRRLARNRAKRSDPRLQLLRRNRCEIDAPVGNCNREMPRLRRRQRIS